ncbi:MAG TPA: bifunctional diguanylate cyclase/phosphodiesterase [Acidimicrobiia bacterium]|nr:bifunctional diguanylate cyclase/phosphodiesterase [Acidimicrobiia bacterium]
MIAAVRQSKSIRLWAALSSNQRLTLLVWSVATAGGVALTVAIANVLATPALLNRTFVLVLLATLCTDALSLDLRVGRHSESYTWAEVNVVLALALLPPALLVLTALAVAPAHLVARRPAIKVMFNTASYAVGIAIAAIVTHAVATPSWRNPLISAAALVAGAAAFSLWNGVAVDAAIAVSQGLSLRGVSRKGLRMRVAVAVGNIAIAGLVLVLARVEPYALFAVPPCLAVAYLTYRGLLRSLQERSIWRHLEAMGQEVNRLDERAVAIVAVVRAASLFEADEVHVALYGPGLAPGAHLYVGNANGVSSIRAVSRADLDGCLATGTTCAACTGGGINGDETRAAVVLGGRHDQIGVLCVRFFAKVKLTDREQRLLQTFANTISTSLENARLYHEMAEHAARHEMAAMHDPLTGLPNRTLLQERVAALLQHGDASHSFAVMLMDLDHFKDVNDGLGHVVGDEVLCEIATRLRKSARGHDLVCRLGGDEFAILVDDASAAVPIAERLAAVAAQPIEVNGAPLSVGGSIGFACYPEDGATFEELIQHADVAMYQAKSCRGSLRRYRKSRDGASQTTKDRLRLVAELRTALEQQQFELHYQPQIDLSTGEAVAAEALVRWRHPTRGLLLPGEFMALVESSSLIRPFTCMVLDQAVEECARWQRPHRPLHVAVNLSARNLDDERLADDVVAVLERHQLPANRLVLEITETAMMGDLDFVEEQMARLAKLGVSLSIDDFGTGSSSLTFLQRVMVHELKIDRSFVAGIVSNENDAAITRATVRLAQSLGLRTVAEGVEDPAVMRELVELRCDSAQGFLWSRPVPVPAIRRFLGVAVDRGPASPSAPLVDVS